MLLCGREGREVEVYGWAAAELVFQLKVFGLCAAMGAAIVGFVGHKATGNI
jgi:hypothetical protein